MANNISTYTIDLQIRDDKSRDAIRGLESSLKGVGDIAKNAVKTGAMTSGLDDAQRAADGLIGELGRLAKDSSVDFSSVADSYARSSKKAIGELERQYVGIVAVQKESADLEKEISDLRGNGGDLQQILSLEKRLGDIYTKNNISSSKDLDLKIRQNRQIRANLKAAGLEAQNAQRTEKIKETYGKKQVERSKQENKLLDLQTKKQKEIVKNIELQEKAQKKIEKSAGAIKRAWDGVGASSGKAASKISGAGVAGKVKSGVGAASRGIGFISGAMSAIGSAADRSVEMERAAGRIKGYDAETAQKMISDMYIATGADASDIVDAINRVGVAIGKGVSKDEVMQAAQLELRYPGMASMFLSQDLTNASAENFGKYKGKLAAIQKATGATDDQIAASMEALATRGDISSGSISDYQAIYLAMQNSGAFGSDEALNNAFNDFVKKQKESGQNIFDFAKGYDLSGTLEGREKMQAQAAQKSIDWGSIETGIAAGAEAGAGQPSAAESMSARLRKLEEQKNELLMKLIPVVLPVVERIAAIFDSENGKGKEIIDGIAKLVENVIPMLEPLVSLALKVLNFLNEYIFPAILWLVDKINSIAGDGVAFTKGDSSKILGNKNSTPQNAAGGIAYMPSIVGERGPEAIIPLDFARSQRAANISNNIIQNFHMGTNATTVLSLSQAVKTRDFTHAMAQNSYMSKRSGVL